MISVKEAQDIILAEIVRMRQEKVLLSNALGRVLSDSVTSPLNNPPWDTSAMDGYAVRLSDVVTASRKNPQRLKVVEEIPAGKMPQRKVGRGEAAKIMTGAPLPEGADAVVKVEETKTEEREVAIFTTPESGEYIRQKGEAIRLGAPVLAKGIRLRSAEIAMLASLGIVVVPVYQKPRIAILSTGNELAELGESRGNNKIFNCNGYGLMAQVMEAGGIPVNLGIARDTKEALLEKVKEGSFTDFLLISGGVSMGDYDYVIEVLTALGVKMRFWKVAMKPGKPLAFGMLAGCPIFGLPGNPVSSMVTFEQFVRPALLFSAGRSDLFRPPVTAKLEKDVHRLPGRRHFIRAIVSIKNGEYRVRSTGDQDSAILMSLVKSNALMILPPDTGILQAGRKVSVQLLSEVTS